MYKVKTYTVWSVRLALLALWVPVAADKLWDLQRFRNTLLRQPFPDWWANVLFWLLPLLELLAAVLIAWPKKPRLHRLGLWLSAILMLGFTLFILFGVLGWYEKRPCGCGSVISGLSWEQHLWFNLGFLLLSMLGIWLTRPSDGHRSHTSSPCRRQEVPSDTSSTGYRLFIALFKMRYPRKFAVFRRGAECVNRTLS